MAAKQQTLGAYTGRRSKAKAKPRAKARSYSSPKKPARKTPMVST